ncbi:MAG: TPM domain-containing protein [Hyphomicrobium sp.]
MNLFSEDGRQRVSEAIIAAERKTSGEIIAVVAESSDTYVYAPFLWSALAALLVPWPLIHFTWIAVQWIYLLQLVVFFTLVALLWPRHVRTALSPKSLRDRHVQRRATEQFLAQNLHTTAGRTGVLIFVSVAERRAVILADTGIDSKVPDGAWQQIVDRMTTAIGGDRAADGFVAAIGEIGVLLAAHFPPGVYDPNELPDHLIVLDD